MEKAGFDDGANVFFHFKVAVKGYSKVLGGGADIGDKGIRGIEGGGSVMVKYNDFCFALVQCQEVIAHP